MPRIRRAFTDEFKREAVRLVKQPWAMVTHIARDPGTKQSVLRRWVSQEHGGVMDMRANKPLRIESASEVKRLQRELRWVTTERDILKKSARLLCKGLAVKYAFVVRHRDVWTTRAMCRVMHVSASGFYEWFGRPASEHSQTDTRLTRSIRESFELSDRTYGSPRVWHDLRAAGEQCGINRDQPRDAPDEGGEPAGQAQAP